MPDAPIEPQEIGTLREELRENYAATKAYLGQVTAKEYVDPKEVVPVLNSLSAILRDLIKLDDAVYNQERLQQIEQVMVDTMREMPDEVKQRFFDLYKRRLTDVTKPS